MAQISKIPTRPHFNYVKKLIKTIHVLQKVKSI